MHITLLVLRGQRSRGSVLNREFPAIPVRIVKP
jgi:hypothetical protein